jgi:hypothetical protein
MLYLNRYAAAAVLAMTLTAGCDLADVPLPVDGSAEATALMRFVNYRGTTVNVLRVQAGLEETPALSVVLHRNGPDGVCGTADDMLFDTIAELADVAGAEVVAPLGHFALVRQWLPGQDPFLGSYDGVSFTLSEAERTLRAANDAPAELLDGEASLYANVVDAIVAARPFGSVDQLARLPRVGRVNLSRLKAFALGNGAFSDEAYGLSGR